MSFFYLTAVKGDMPIHLLESIIVKRLQYLKSVFREDDSVYNEYVIEGSVYDNVGHFMLCVVAILGENTGFTQFVLKSEIELFKRRLASLTAYDLRCFAKKLLRTIKKHEYLPSYTDPLRVLCRHFILKDLAQHICTSHKPECEKYNIKVNFRHCLRFIATRQVELKNGSAIIPCRKWKHYLTELFRKNITHRLNTNVDTLKSDPRIMELLKRIRREFFPNTDKASKLLLSAKVDDSSKLFPPCMTNLHHTLRQKHRLSHAQRFYYSLFLKDIGMPIEEAIGFWGAEYRQSPNGTHTCCHNWEKDEKKYLYGIRHMYGLEGCRKNYTSVNCQRIQSVDNACTEGGCPFKSFDSHKMISLLHNPSEQLILQINELKRKNLYTKSCMLYLSSLVGTVDCDTLSFNFTPVKYYAIASKTSVD